MGENMEGWASVPVLSVLASQQRQCMCSQQIKSSSSDCSGFLYAC